MTMLSARNGAPAGTQAAYITDEEKKLLMRRDALMGKKKREFTPEGIPVLRPRVAGVPAHFYTTFEGKPGGDAMLKQIESNYQFKADQGVSKKVARKETKMADQYAASKETGKDYKGYVDSSKQLTEALNKIKNDPGSKEAKYWGRRIVGGAENATAESFGVALMGENKALVSNKYAGKPSSATAQALGRGTWKEGETKGSGFMERQFAGKRKKDREVIGPISTCFIDGVQVELADGSEKNVSEISVGDTVKTKKGDGSVVKVFHSKAGNQRLYGFNDKEPFATEAHPFMTQDGWKKISEVEIGDTLYRNGLGLDTVKSIVYREISEDTPVYNFHVGGEENYYADGYLVHNKTIAAPKPKEEEVDVDKDGDGDGDTTFDSSGLKDAFLDEIVVEGTSSEVIEERLKNLINKNNPLFKAASTRALQEMARRGSGLINSSMAEEAVIKAIMDIALPIVMEDAKNYREQRQLNQGLTNAEITDFNNNYYETFQVKLQASMDRALCAMTERAANWRAILAERGATSRTAGMSSDAVRASMGAVTPPWYSSYGGG